MNNGWKAVPLEALAVQQKGAIKIGPFGSQLKKRDLVSSGVHVVGIENVLSETFDGLGDRFISLDKFQTLRTVEILPGDLLITMMGTIGKVAIVPDGIETSIMDSHLLRVRPDRKLCRTDYLAWAIRGSPAVQQSMDAQAHGAIMRGLNSAIVRSLPILLPPLPEQQRIVGILDEAFEGTATAKANAEKNLQNARGLFESHLQSVFTQRGKGWVETTIGEVCDFRGGGTPSKAVERYWKGKIPWVSPKDMKFEIVSDSIDHISMEAVGGSATTLIPKGAVLMVVRSGILARIVPLAVAGRELAINQDLKALCPKNIIESRFLYSLLESKMPILQSMVSRGATVHRLMTEQIRSLACSLPPKAEQHRIVGLVDSMREQTQRLASLYKRKLAALEALKKSLLHQAFTGEL